MASDPFARRKSMSAPSSAQLGQAVVAWVNTFNEELTSLSDGHCSNMVELCDGVILFELCAQLAPTYFEFEDVDRNTSDKPLAGVGNLNKLLRRLESFFFDTIEQKLDLNHLNLQAIARDHDINETIKLFELVLYCTVKSERREEAVGNIMALEEAEQQMLMELINGAMSKYENQDASNTSVAASPQATPSSNRLAAPHSPNVGSSSAPPSPPLSPLASTPTLSTPAPTGRPLSEAKLMQTIKELKEERSLLSDKIDAVSRELRDQRRVNDDLKEDYAKLVAERDSSVRNAVADAVAAEKREAEEKRRAENQRVHRALEDAENKTQEMKVQLIRVTDQAESVARKRTDEITELKAELRKVQDELDVAKENGKKLAQAEAKLARYKEKLGAAEEVSSQLKFTEDQQTQNLERIVALEGEVKQVPLLKAQVSKYKDSVFLLEGQVTDLKVAEEHTRGELAAAKEEVKQLKEEKKAAADELETARNELHALRTVGDSFAPAATTRTTVREVIPADVKEKLIRLESENKQLREGGDSDSRVIALMDELDMAKRTGKANEDKYLKAQLKVIDLEGAMKRAQQAPVVSAAAAPTTPSANPQEEIDRLREQVLQLSTSLALKKEVAATGMATSADSSSPAEIAAANAKIEALMTRNKKLEQFAKQAQRKLKVSEERMTKIVNQGQGATDTNKTLRKQLDTREAEIKERERIRTEAEKMVMREQRLVAAAFYELGMEFHTALAAGRAIRATSTERPIDGKSWLNKQRVKA